MQETTQPIFMKIADAADFTGLSRFFFVKVAKATKFRILEAEALISSTSQNCLNCSTWKEVSVNE